MCRRNVKIKLLKPNQKPSCCQINNIDIQPGPKSDYLKCVRQKSVFQISEGSLIEQFMTMPNYITDVILTILYSNDDD